VPAGTARVYSVNDFKQGLDVRKSALTAPGGSLRILENCMVNQGGEIEKRFAFVPMTVLSPETVGMIGQGGALHIFGFDVLSPLDNGQCPVPIAGHILHTAGLPDTPTWIIDIEPYDNDFFVCAGSPTRFYCFWKGQPVKEVDGSFSQGTFARTYKSKLYRIDAHFLRFSGVGDPSVNDPANVNFPGAGFINIALNDPEGETLQAMEVYYDKMAVMARLMTQMWTLAPDPDSDTLTQVLRIGTVARHSAVQFGTGDILFLSDSGVRSLKALNAAMSAAVSDVGSAIDPLLIEEIKSDPFVLDFAAAIVQPIKGRYWLAILDKIYVLSHFPAGDITAWSILQPGFQVLSLTVAGNMVFLRDNNQNLYLYGGLTLGDYDSCPVTSPHAAPVDRQPHRAQADPERRCHVRGRVVGFAGDAAEQHRGVRAGGEHPGQHLRAPVHPVRGLRHARRCRTWSNQAPGPATLSAMHLHVLEAGLK
jgi:hypothetical protein